MIKADNSQKRCFIACDEQRRKDGNCSCYSNIKYIVPETKSVCEHEYIIDNLELVCRFCNHRKKPI